MKVSKRLCALLLAGVMIMLPVIKTQAAVYGGYRWEDSAIKYNYIGWMFHSGATSWSGLDATFVNASTYYGVDCYIVSEPEATWDGKTKIGQNMTHIVSAIVTINSASSMTWNDNEALKSVASHEFGHVLGLNDVSQECAIMNSATWGEKSRYGTYKLTSPTQDEKNTINSIY